MKTLKVNSLLLSFLAVALISSFLTSCEKNDSMDTLKSEVLTPKVASAIEDIDLLPNEAFDSAPTYLPTDVEIGEMRLNSRANSTSVDADIYIIATDEYFAAGDIYNCYNFIYHRADWDSSYGTCPPSKWTWYNVQKKRANGNFTTEFSVAKYGDVPWFSPDNLSNGEYLSAVFAWNQCQGKWTLEATLAPQHTICVD